ncbi:MULTISPECIES: ABC transporter permease [unclassified Lactobacillus]|uniref:ABC transporter permease n=1 Tax=unclassified Lactobacillus TaxID=2620435 RepID=UPI000EFA3147|nr:MULTISPECIES: ABC transporter permease [unclassified Lactobacillus]RMC23677.1 ABC transporter permease [Lactobacillus sp. ESL0247]RMC27437.1 ABC transporter permease [Lactobacillus sp. ESL0246]RMC30638.1 ABC transporter permease [Lactobacillus sp. ESL0245]
MDLVAILSLLVSSTIVYSTPLIFTSLGGVYSENSGITNIGLEGIMTMGAFSSIMFNLTFASSLGKITPWIGLIVGGIVGLIFSLLHAVATINFHADHVISGTVLNLMAPPLAVFLVKAIYDKGQTENISQSFGYFNFPGLADIPVIGQILFQNTFAPAWVAIIVTIILWWILYKTRFGLRLRSCGENPQAADTVGVNVYGMRYVGVLTSGLLGGIGGAVFAEAISGNFSISTIVGQGFMALAAMIFGKWNPLGAMLASLFFGFAQSISIIGNQLPLFNHIPSVYMQIAPYAITIIILVLFFGKSVAPAADGQNYIKSK